MPTITVSKRKTYDQIKGAILLVLTAFLGPGVYGAVMGAVQTGDVKIFAMGVVLILVAVVLVVTYRWLDYCEEKEEKENDDPDLEAVLDNGCPPI